MFPYYFPKKNPDLILGLEVKGHNDQGVMVSFPSIHKNGHQYKPVGRDTLNKWSKAKTEAFLSNIIKSCGEHGIEYPKDHNQNHKSNSLEEQ